MKGYYVCARTEIKTNRGWLGEKHIISNEDGLTQADVDALVERGILAEIPSMPEPVAAPQQPAKVPPVVGAMPTNWGFDPMVLQAMNVEQLNILIADHAERLKVETPGVFDTREEAIAYLTQDK